MAPRPEPTDEPNPYAAPSADLGPALPDLALIDSEDEALRRRHLTHEARVRSIGFLGFFFAFFQGLYGVAALVGTIVLAVILILRNPGRLYLEILPVLALAGVSVLCLSIAFGFFALGRGLRRLKNWARWTWVVLFSLSPLLMSVVGVVFGVRLALGMVEDVPEGVAETIGAIAGIFAFYYLLPGWLLYLLLCRESRVVFTPEYRAVVARTPHIRYKTSRTTKIVVALTVAALIALAVVVGVMSS